MCYAIETTWSYDTRHTGRVVGGKGAIIRAIIKGSVISSERQRVSAQQKRRRDDQTNGSPPLSIPMPPKAINWPRGHMCVRVCGFSQKMTPRRELRMETNGPSVRVGEKRTEGKRNGGSGIPINRVYPDE